MQNKVEAAIEAAGGYIAVAFHMGFKSDETVRAWARRGRVPHYHVERLCELGGNKVPPQELSAQTSAAA